MGYNFIVAGVDVAFSTTGAGTVVIDVKVAQIGIAPFYYPLSIILSCPDPLLSWPIVLPGVETLIDEGESKTFRFEGVPATARCLQSVNLRLHSKRTYRNRPIKFAQGTAGTVTFSIPMPPAEKVQEVFSIAYTLFRITNGTSTDAFALTNGTNVDLAQVGKMLSIRADVKLDSEIDVAFTFGKEANYEKTKPFTLMAVQQGKDVAASYLSSVGSKTIRIAVVGTGGTVLTQQVLIFQVVDSSKVR